VGHLQTAVATSLGLRTVCRPQPQSVIFSACHDWRFFCISNVS